MKVLVYPHDLGIGGSQINAIEIAAGVRDQGHDVAVFGRTGALVPHIDHLGLEFIESPRPHRRPSANVSLTLARLIRQRGIDIVHGYEWPPALESLGATRLAPRAVAISTVMSMSVAPFLPKYLPLVVGTEEIVDAESRFGRSKVDLIEPPVDLNANRPDGEFGQQEFRQKWGLSRARFTVVMVTRLAKELKLEGVLSAIAAIGTLAETRPVSLVIVGDGPARAQVDVVAEQVNRVRGAGTVVMTGQLSDPRAAYAIADITLGMGGSALRSLAFQKPLIVQGENGFWELLTPLSLPQFLWRGWYGVGRDSSRGADRLVAILERVLTDTTLRSELGEFGLKTVRERFSLERAARLQIEIYEDAMVQSKRRSGADDVRALSAFAGYEIGRFADRIRGRLASDDFNSVPVAGAKGEPEGSAVVGARS